MLDVIAWDRLPHRRTIVMEIFCGKTKYILFVGLRNGPYAGTFDLWLVIKLSIIQQFTDVKKKTPANLVYQTLMISSLKKPVPYE